MSNPRSAIWPALAALFAGSTPLVKLLAQTALGRLSVFSCNRQ
ncbi:MAG: hypothetical protein Q7T65_13135 [Thiobacillus sp.]|nr:hypothetical protein [Thiobacillus sp.]